MNTEIAAYNNKLEPNDRAICDLLATEIDKQLPQSESKVWHAHPVWFLDGNPIVGYSKQNPIIRLMFWSGADFREPGRGWQKIQRRIYLSQVSNRRQKNEAAAMVK